MAGRISDSRPEGMMYVQPVELTVFGLVEKLLTLVR